MRFRRLLSVVALLAVAVSGLTACQTKVGQAVAVGEQTLSDSALSGYTQPGASPYVDQQNAQVVPKLNVLTNWVRNRLIEATIAAHGGAVTTPELNAAQAVIVQSGLPKQIELANRSHGYTSDFYDLLTEQYALLVVLIERLAKTSNAGQAFNILQSGRANQAFLNAINATHVPVDLTKRYGTWEQNGLHVSTDPAAGAPDFVTFGSG
ncbi:MAG TPA: hypothetical protein VIG48_02940 [Jatrophihabitans sp.]